MPTYIIEREIPGASQLTDDELRGITHQVQRGRVATCRGPTRGATATSRATRSTASTRPRTPTTSVEHARGGGFPANLVAEVARGVRQHRPARAAGLSAGHRLGGMPGSALIGRRRSERGSSAALAAAARGQGSLMLRQRRGRGRQDAPRRGRPRRRRTRVFVRGAATPVRLAVRPRHGGVPRATCAPRPDGLMECGPLRSRLALLLPELGPAEPSADRATLFEAIRCGLAAMVAAGPAAILLDDLQWSDEATLELLAALALAAAASSRCSSSPPTAPTSSRARTRCAACATTCAATGRCTRSPSSR